MTESGDYDNHSKNHYYYSGLGMYFEPYMKDIMIMIKKNTGNQFSFSPLILFSLLIIQFWFVEHIRSSVFYFILYTWDRFPLAVISNCDWKRPLFILLWTLGCGSSLVSVLLEFNQKPRTWNQTIQGKDFMKYTRLHSGDILIIWWYAKLTKLFVITSMLVYVALIVPTTRRIRSI